MPGRERVPKKQCPQCGWDAEGKPVDGAAPEETGTRTRYDPPPEHAYECGNCGYRWVQ